MVYNDWRDLGWEPFVKSWLSNRQNKVKHNTVLNIYLMYC